MIRKWTLGNLWTVFLISSSIAAILYLLCPKIFNNIINQYLETRPESSTNDAAGDLDLHPSSDQTLAVHWGKKDEVAKAWKSWSAGDAEKHLLEYRAAQFGAPEAQKAIKKRLKKRMKDSSHDTDHWLAVMEYVDWQSNKNWNKTYSIDSSFLYEHTIGNEKLKERVKGELAKRSEGSSKFCEWWIKVMLDQAYSRLEKVKGVKDLRQMQKFVQLLRDFRNIQFGDLKDKSKLLGWLIAYWPDIDNNPESVGKCINNQYWQNCGQSNDVKRLKRAVLLAAKKLLDSNNFNQAQTPLLLFINDDLTLDSDLFNIGVNIKKTCTLYQEQALQIILQALGDQSPAQTGEISKDARNAAKIILNGTPPQIDNLIPVCRRWILATWLTSDDAICSGEEEKQFCSVRPDKIEDWKAVIQEDNGNNGNTPQWSYLRNWIKGDEATDEEQLKPWFKAQPKWVHDTEILFNEIDRWLESQRSMMLPVDGSWREDNKIGTNFIEPLLISALTHPERGGDADRRSRYLAHIVLRIQIDEPAWWAALDLWKKDHPENCDFATLLRETRQHQ